MELVYLWVDKYKNIEKHGFNFSPRFECSFDGKTLTIDKKKEDEYVKDFFGKNINVTTIVGKNGSGKSSVLKFIREIIDGKVNNGSFLIFYNKTNNKYICIYTDSKINSNVELEQYNIISKHIIFPLFDYSLTYDNSMSFKNEQLPVYPKKEKGFLDFHRELISNQKNIINNFIDLKQKKLLDKFEDFFKPNEIRVLFDLKELKPYSSEILEDRQEVQYNEFIDRFQKNTSIQKALDLIEQLINLLSNKESYQSKEDPFEQIQSLPTLKKELRRLEDEAYNYGEGYMADNIWEKNENKKLLIAKNRLDSILEIENKYILFSFDIDDSFNDIMNIILDSFPPTYFEIELIDNEKKLSELSFGEQQLLFILNQIYTLTRTPDQDLSDYIDSSSPDRYQKINYIILFDEIDIGFHPDWQKKTIQYIIDFLNETDDAKYYHLIFTTHSPFLLSDIPKENIIFLNDEPSIKQTFGANIHTLLSDSFFMDDGLMGEFAKKKINKIIKNLKDKDYSPSEKEKRQIYLTIESIGEPFLKQKLSKMYFDKFDTEKQDRIKELKAELKRLENG